MKILIADDHTLFRDVLNNYLLRLNKTYDLELTTTLENTHRLLKKNARDPYNLVIIDLCIPEMNGFDGLRHLKQRWPEQPVAIMSAVAQAWEVGQSIQNGAAGFFPKSMSGAALVHAVDLVISGEKFVPIEYLAPPIHSTPPPSGRFEKNSPERGPGHYQLTPRENDVLKYLIRGASNQDIANGLDLQTVTVKLHVRSICKKLGAKNRTQAALFARDGNIVRTDI